MSLSLKRRPGEKVHIGGVTIQIGRINGPVIQLLIDAPADMPITRPTKDQDTADRLDALKHRIESRKVDR